MGGQSIVGPLSQDYGSKIYLGLRTTSVGTSYPYAYRIAGNFHMVQFSQID